MFGGEDGPSPGVVDGAGRGLRVPFLAVEVAGGVEVFGRDGFVGVLFLLAAADEDVGTDRVVTGSSPGNESF